MVNRFVYSSNDPVNRWDPLGLEDEEPREPTLCPFGYVYNPADDRCWILPIGESIKVPLGDPPPEVWSCGPSWDYGILGMVSDESGGTSRDEGAGCSLGGCLVRCGAEEFGLDALIGGSVGAATTPFPRSWVRKVPGNSKTTNLLSVAGVKFRDSAWNRMSTRRLGTKNLLRFLGRFASKGAGRLIPGVGWALFAWDAYKIGKCVQECMESCSATE